MFFFKCVGLMIFVVAFNLPRSESSTCCPGTTGSIDNDCPDECTPIANCLDVLCSNSSEERCGRCDGDYGPALGSAYKQSDDMRQCIRQCSWREDSNACYPGSCINGQCRCSSGFLGDDCRTMDSSQAPVISEHHATLIRGSTTQDSSLTVQGSAATVYTNVQDFTSIRINWTSFYQPSGLPDIRSGGHPYIDTIELGVVGTTVTVFVHRTRRSRYAIGFLPCRTPTTGDSIRPRSPATSIVNCEHTIHLRYSRWTPANGDVLEYVVDAASGGYMLLYDRDHSNRTITRLYFSYDARSRTFSNLTFDFEDPYHCVDVGRGCRTTMLNTGSDVTLQPVISVTWQGWVDDLAGIKEYNLRVQQLAGNHGNEMTEILDGPAVHSSIVKFEQNSSLYSTEVTLPHVGVYSVVLTAVDKAGNTKLSRRFVFFDGDPNDVTIQSNASLRLLSASEETGFVWLTNLDADRGETYVDLVWTNHFINVHHHNQGLLKPIRPYAKSTIDSDYDQHFGQRGRAAIPNVLGVTEFRVSHDIDHSGGRTIVIVSDDNSNNWSNEGTNTQATYNLTLVDGDSIRFWVEARDIAGHFVRDSVLIHADSSPPIIEHFRLIPGLSGISAECQIYDIHSGVKTIEWHLFGIRNNTEVEQALETHTAIQIDMDVENCDPASCKCVPNGDCYAIHYKAAFLIGASDFEHFIMLNVTNHAGLVMSKTVKTNCMVTKDNVDKTAETLALETNDTSSIDAEAVVSTADLLDSIVNAQDTSPEVTANVVRVMKNLLEVDTRSLNYTKDAANTSSRIIQALEKQISNVLIAGKNISEVTANLVVVAVNLNPSLLDGGVKFAAISRGDGSSSLSDDDLDIYFGSGIDDIPVEKVQASIKLPGVIVSQFPSGGPDVPVSFAMYDSSSLFQSRLIKDSQTTDAPRVIGSRIVSASMQNICIDNLPRDSSVEITFRLKQDVSQNSNTYQTETCVFWDFNLHDGIGDWSTDGCRKGSSVNGRIVCLCDHATNFAVLVTSHVTDVDQAADRLASLTNDTSSIDADSFASTADLLNSIVNSQDTSPEVTASVVRVVSNLLQVDTRGFSDTTSAANSSSRVIRALERQLLNVLAAGKNVSEVMPNVAVTAMHFNPDSLVNGVGFAAISGGTGSSSLVDEDIGVYQGPDGDIPVEKVEASVKLPEVILRKFPPGSSVPISFVMYDSSNLFRSGLIEDSQSTDSPHVVGSRIISASVLNASINNLPTDSPVVNTFLSEQVLSENEVANQTCVFWDFSLRDGIGDWSTDGCRKGSSVNGRIVCLCDHATNFAVLVNIHSQANDSLALDVISKIGCAVSIVALIITIIIYSALRSLRSKLPNRILISFSLSLLCLYLVFVAGVDQTSSRVGCIIVAVLLHYFTLTSVAWMGVEAAGIYLKLIRILNSDVEHFMIKASVAAWGLPVLVVTVILAVDYTVYENEYSCFLKPGAAFYYGQLLIIGLVFLFNAVIFALALRKLVCCVSDIQNSANKSKSKRAKIVKRVQNMAAISTLLGLTWVFGLLSIIEAASTIFGPIFAILNSLQGLFIFLLFVVRQNKIRELVVGRWRGKKDVTLTSSHSGVTSSHSGVTSSHSGVTSSHSTVTGSPLTKKFVSSSKPKPDTRSLEQSRYVSINTKSSTHRPVTVETTFSETSCPNLSK